MEELEASLVRESDRVGVELYLALLAYAATQNKWTFKTIENLYYDEQDLKSIDLKKILFSHINLRDERNQFLKYVNRLTLEVFNIFNDIIVRYQGKVSSVRINGI